MGFFNKKKENKKEVIEELIRPENEKVIYRDGVFEVFEDTADGKKYGRILKYHGGEKIIDISDEEFALWADAAENFNKYRITYERDEEFFIEKAHIELATADAPEKTEEKEQEMPVSSPNIPLSEEDKREFSELVEFYNNAVQSPDVAKAGSITANLAQSIAACLISSLAKQSACA